MEFSRLAVSVKVWALVSFTATAPVTVPATASVTVPATARSFTRSCGLSFDALTFFLALYTCTLSQGSN